MSKAVKPSDDVFDTVDGVTIEKVDTSSISGDITVTISSENKADIISPLVSHSVIRYLTQRGRGRLAIVPSFGSSLKFDEDKKVWRKTIILSEG